MKQIELKDVLQGERRQCYCQQRGGVCYDAYALCQKRKDLSISKEIPVYVWHGVEDKTIPLSYIKYFQSKYSVKAEHVIDNIGHMLYLPYWKAIIAEATSM